MVTDAGLAYKDTDEKGREIYCPVCLTYCENKGFVVIGSYPKPHITKKLFRGTCRLHGTSKHCSYRIWSWSGKLVEPALGYQSAEQLFKQFGKGVATSNSRKNC